MRAVVVAEARETSPRSTPKGANRAVSRAAVERIKER